MWQDVICDGRKENSLLVVNKKALSELHMMQDIFIYNVVFNKQYHRFKYLSVYYYFILY